MSEIRRVGGAAGPLSAGRPTRSGSGFRVAESASGRTDPSASASAPAAAGLSLLGLQEVSETAERDARARKRGLALIEALQSLQAALLRGRVEPDLLRRMAALAEGETAADPVLAELLAGIRQRARIELARLEAARVVASS